MTDDFIDAIRNGDIDGLTIDPENPAMAYDDMSLSTPTGARVRFTGHGGYQRDQDYARRLLTVGEFYTVASISVGSWSSTVAFFEFPGEAFNTVMFAQPRSGTTSGAASNPTRSGPD